MTSLEGTLVRLRALEPGDIDTIYRWENDPAIWPVSGTTAPFSRHMLERFIEEQKYDIFATRQQRFVIETLTGSMLVGILDLFEFDPQNCRAGVGILIHDPQDRNKGYASDAMTVICEYARTIRLHQLWCSVGADNTASRRLFDKAGFEQTGVKRAWNWTPEGYQDEILMQKIL